MRRCAHAPGRASCAHIFLGGGTPSLMEPATVGAILDTVSRHWTVPHGIEVTLEANPSSVEAERFRGYRAAGVNRVSLGVQALNDPDLRFLGRLHDVDGGAERDRPGARDLSAPVLRPDLCAAPADGRGVEDRAERAIGSPPTICRFTNSPLRRARASTHCMRRARLSSRTRTSRPISMRRRRHVTAARGLPAYEISNHARPGAESRHNLIYWRYGEYVGMGPGAHGSVYRARPPGRHHHREDTGDLARSGRNPGATASSTAKCSTRSEEADEYLLMGLRLAEGIDLDPLRAAVGPSARAQALGRLAG